RAEGPGEGVGGHRSARRLDGSADPRGRRAVPAPETKTPAGAGAFATIVLRRLLGGGDRGGLRAVHQLDVRHRRVVARAEAGLEDAQVATRARVVARAELDEQLADRFLVLQAGHGQAAVGDAIDLA